MMKAPGDKRPTWREGIIQIHITRACDLACTNCTQGSQLSGKPTMMTLPNFTEACLSLQNYFGVIGIFGGNPCLHPLFEEFCSVLRSTIPFEQRGLWSNNLNGYGKLCRETFNPAVSNLNVHTNSDAYAKMKRDWPECNPIGLDDSRHSPPFVAMKDLDLSREEQTRLINNCDVNQLWSAMICQFRGELRAYFCELAGAQSMLHENEIDYPDTGIFPYKNWWRKPIEYFDDQIHKHCYECGIPLRGLGDLAVNGKVEQVSKTHLNIYKLKKSGTREIQVVSKVSELGGRVERATDYIANGAKVMNGTETKILIGIPTVEMARRADFYDYLGNIARPEGTRVLTIHSQSPAMGRNLIIQKAIDEDFSHVLFLDDDVKPRPDLLMNLLNCDKDLVTGLYLMRNFPHFPIIFDFVDQDGRCQFMFPDEQGLVEIVACGLGAILIKTSVFRAMDTEENKQHGRGQWIRLGELDRDNWSDDIGFFHRVRKAGFKIHCDLNSLVGHDCAVTVYPEFKDGKWMTTYDTRGEGTVSIPSIVPEWAKKELV